MFIRSCLYLWAVPAYDYFVRNYFLLANSMKQSSMVGEIGIRLL